MSAQPYVLCRSLDWPQVFLGGLLIALGDMAFAITVWFSWNATGFVQVFQTIAVGVLGKASYEGGVPSAVLGAALHLFMASMFVVIYASVARRVPALLRRPFVLGPAYGVVLYIVMNFVVMPLSRVGRAPSLTHMDTIAYSVVAHMVFGVIAVLFARRALRGA
ncbi:hypothetical protein [Dokdonella soli]|uniref:DUF1440 domain-containing protein n=1 Tax=Dokdonella soli TaxID=529810 RepID=A0ABN1IDC4_9GAMM